MGLVLVQGLSKTAVFLSRKGWSKSYFAYYEKKVNNRGFSKIHLLSCAKEVINAIEWVMDWSIKSMVLDIIECASDWYVNIDFNYIHRKLNESAII